MNYEFGDWEEYAEEVEARRSENRKGGHTAGSPCNLNRLNLNAETAELIEEKSMIDDVEGSSEVMVSGID